MAAGTKKGAVRGNSFGNNKLMVLDHKPEDTVSLTKPWEWISKSDEGKLSELVIEAKALNGTRGAFAPEYIEAIALNGTHGAFAPEYIKATISINKSHVKGATLDAEEGHGEPEPFAISIFYEWHRKVVKTRCSGLSNPKGLLSSCLLSQVITLANKEMEKVTSKKGIGKQHSQCRR